MSIDRIRVTFGCDNCGRQFHVDMDEGEKLPGGSVFDAAVSAIMGGHQIEPAPETSGLCSVQDGRHLCAVCTKVYDDEYFRQHPEELAKAEGRP